MRFKSICAQVLCFAIVTVLLSAPICDAQNTARLETRSTRVAATPTARSFASEAKSIGEGSVRSWVLLDDKGNPTEIGVTFTERSLSGLPGEPPPGLMGTEYMLPLPAEAGATGFNHIGLDWNPHGHMPHGVYTVPHFDFHFYLISAEDRDAIKVDPKDLSKFQKTPPAEFIPEGYMLAPQSEYPRMGSHWIEPGSHEFHGQAFTQTMIYGFYDGRMVFIEPMISKAFLETKPNVTIPIKLPAKYSKPGYYPTRYSIKYNPDTQEYTVSLEGLTVR